MQQLADDGMQPSGASFFDFPDDGLPSGEQIYDKIMGGIDRELTSKNIAMLEEKYKNETPEQKKVRAQRYEKAYEEYEKRYALYQAGRASSMKRFKAQAMQSLESQERQTEESNMQSLESQMQTL